MKNEEYQLLDTGSMRKLERFGNIVLDRPCLQAIWEKKNPHLWEGADAVFTREPEGVWKKRRNFPEQWEIETAGISFLLRTTDFGHLGIFPEQGPFWQWIREEVQQESKEREIRVLNLFAYSGGATLAAAQGGGHVCHLDASKKMVNWARENASNNGLKDAPIRWIVDDVKKFLRRELKRGRKYEGIILDPPSFGRGPSGELFKIEEDLSNLLSHCFDLLAQDPLFILLSCHTPGITPLSLQNMLASYRTGKIDSGEMVIEGPLPLPSGCYARWRP